jgi:hypothetical protein
MMAPFEAAMEIADVAEDGDFDSCGFGYKPTRGPNVIPDEAEMRAEI